MSTPPWWGSNAKPLLREDVLAKVVAEDMDAKSVFDMHPECKLHKFNNFKTNRKNSLDACNTQRKQHQNWRPAQRGTF